MQVKFAGNPVKLKGSTIEKGQVAPDFDAVTNSLEGFKLSDVEGKKIILAVPSLDTPVCDMEVRKFNAEAAQLRDVTVITISMDLPFAQARWCGAAGVDNVITVSDFKDRDFAEKYGVYMEANGLLARAVFVLDADNKVLHVEYVSEVTAEPNYNAALAAL
jgi:thiol peroxidase